MTTPLPGDVQAWPCADPHQSATYMIIVTGHTGVKRCIRSNQGEASTYQGCQPLFPMESNHVALMISFSHVEVIVRSET